MRSARLEAGFNYLLSSRFSLFYDENGADSCRMSPIRFMADNTMSNEPTCGFSYLKNNTVTNLKNPLVAASALFSHFPQLVLLSVDHRDMLKLGHLFRDDAPGRPHFWSKFARNVISRHEIALTE